MPARWNTTVLGNLGELRNGLNFNRHQEGSGLPVLKVKDFGDPRIPRVWLPGHPTVARRVCSTEFLVTLPTKSSTCEYLWSLFMSEDFVERFASLVTGTSGSHQRVKPEHLLAMPSLLPPADCLARFTDLVGPMLRRVAHVLVESQALTAIRDALLPQLLSGQVPCNHELSEEAR